jgi:hypothetical protein
MQFLWVHWFGVVLGHHYGHRAAWLLKIGFILDSDLLTFGFLDLSLVLRGCHLIPTLNNRRTPDLLTVPCTVAHPQRDCNTGLFSTPPNTAAEQLEKKKIILPDVSSL